MDEEEWTAAELRYDERIWPQTPEAGAEVTSLSVVVPDI